MELINAVIPELDYEDVQNTNMHIVGKFLNGQILPWYPRTVHSLKKGKKTY